MPHYMSLACVVSQCCIASLLRFITTHYAHDSTGNIIFATVQSYTVANISHPFTRCQHSARQLVDRFTGCFKFYNCYRYIQNKSSVFRAWTMPSLKYSAQLASVSVQEPNCSRISMISAKFNGAHASTWDQCLRQAMTVPVRRCQSVSSIICDCCHLWSRIL